MKVLINVCLFLLVIAPVFAYESSGVGYGILHSVNDVHGIYLRNDDEMSALIIRSLHNLELSSKWFGVGADYGYRQFAAYNNNKKNYHDIQSYSIGAGMPDIDFFRLFCYYHGYDLALDQGTSIGRKQKNSAFSVEMGQRYRSVNMISELKGHFYSRIKEKRGDLPYWDDIEMGVINPHQSYGLSAYICTNYDLTFGPAEDNGIAPPEMSPLFLVTQAAGGFFLDFEKVKSDADTRPYTDIDIVVPYTTNPWFGIDLSYHYESFMKKQNHQDIALTLRPTLLRLGPVNLCFLLEPQINIDSYNSKKHHDYCFDGGAIFYFLAKDYSNIWVKAYTYNDWNPERDWGKFENTSYRFSSGVNIRF